MELKANHSTHTKFSTTVKLYNIRSINSSSLNEIFEVYEINVFIVIYYLKKINEMQDKIENSRHYINK